MIFYFHFISSQSFEWCR